MKANRDGDAITTSASSVTGIMLPQERTTVTDIYRYHATDVEEDEMEVRGDVGLAAEDNTLC